MRAPRKDSFDLIYGRPGRKKGSSDESEVPQLDYGLLIPEDESSDGEGTYALTRQAPRQPRGATGIEPSFMQFALDGKCKPICSVETDLMPIRKQGMEKWLSYTDTGKRKRNKFSDGR